MCIRDRCYTPGTDITTLRGQVDVAALRAGDMVLTRDNGFQPIRWVCSTKLNTDRLRAEPDLAPIRIAAGAIAPGLPVADMWVSPQHRMLMTGWTAELLAGQSEVLVPARALVNGTTVTQRVRGPATYFHLALDQHEVIYANGAASESLQPRELAAGELHAHSRVELLRLFPDLASGPAARTCLSVAQGRAFAA